MNKPITVEVVVEGPTENRFIKQLLAPYWGTRNIFVNAPIIRTKVDEQHGKVYKGGDIRFERMKRQIENFLKQRKDVIVASFVDFYGIKEWPGLELIQKTNTPEQIANHLNSNAFEIIASEYDAWQARQRYFPFTAVHEFETLLFSDSQILASELSISLKTVEDVLTQFGSPEAINNSYETAPSKRLEAWTNGLYGKITNGIVIAQKIGIEKMRQKCPLFDTWMKSIEALQEEA